MKLERGFVKYFDAIRIIIAVLIGYGLSLLCLVFVSETPGEAVEAFIIGPFSSWRRLLNIIESMVPLIFTGLGMCMMLSVWEFNMIGDGALYLAGAIISLLAGVCLPENIPPVLYPALLLVIAAVIGGLIALIPALLKIKWNTNEVVVSIMMNYVLIYAGTYILRYWMRDPKLTYLGSVKYPENAQLHNLIPKSQVDTGLILAFVAVITVYWFLNHSKRGFEINLVGSNKSFAKYIGINATGSLILAQFMGGALMGLGGAVELLGKYDRFKWTDNTGFGFDGLMIAVMAFFLAYIRIGSDVVGATTDVPLQFIQVVQGIVIILVGATLLLDGLRKKAIFRIALAEKEGATNVK